VGRGPKHAPGHTTGNTPKPESEHTHSGGLDGGYMDRSPELKGTAVAAKGSDGRGRMRKRNGGGGKGRVHEGNGGSERSCMHERGPDMQERQKGAGARVEWTCLRPREVS